MDKATRLAAEVFLRRTLEGLNKIKELRTCVENPDQREKELLRDWAAVLKWLSTNPPSDGYVYTVNPNRNGPINTISCRTNMTYDSGRERGPER